MVLPKYYTRYPPLGLLKLSSLYKDRGHRVLFNVGLTPAEQRPRKIFITSLFTYSWRPVHETVAYYRSLYPKAEIVLGGVYATLMPAHAKLSGADRIHTGLVQEAESFIPDYSLVPGWESSILFGTRGCIRKCAFCAVPRLEGKTKGPATGVRSLIHPEHTRVVLWDNNILGVPNWREVVTDLKALDVEVDFNQGLDARLIDDDIAQTLSGLRIRPIRMAYDIPNERNALDRAIPALERAGFNRRRMHVYTLYNFTDTPQGFLNRVIDLLSWGVVCYPMRYEPLNSLTKNRYVSPHWTAEQLEMVARARRVLGFGGAFPPYRALLNKLKAADSFEDAFSLRGEWRRSPVGFAGTVQAPTENLTSEQAGYRELMNDPATLGRAVRCETCSTRLKCGERAFAIQDYGARYVGYVCGDCHPNRKWINGLWRSVLGSDFRLNGKASVPLPIGLITSTVH